ncbi:protein kinase domain-containing protein [Ditylenchus destructor]|nr:protein kinase domain-containing protein [Ditylenchus destructor]
MLGHAPIVVVVPPKTLNNNRIGAGGAEPLYRTRGPLFVSTIRNSVSHIEQKYLNCQRNIPNLRQLDLNPGLDTIIRPVIMPGVVARRRRNSSSTSCHPSLAPPPPSNLAEIGTNPASGYLSTHIVTNVPIQKVGKRGGCSLDRQNNNHCFINSSAGRRETRMLLPCTNGSGPSSSSSCSPPSSSSAKSQPSPANNNAANSSHQQHDNEKIILESGCVRRLASRASFYRLYEIGGLIGQGNFSEVYMVYSENSGKKYAVKEIDKNRMNGKLYFVENEIAILKQCNHHRNICRLIDAYECSSLYFLVFEYAHKGDLFETIKRLGRLSERSSAQITYQVASALHYLHCRKIVHRDVKPENILLTADFCVKLTDFGLACTVTGPLYRVCGTPTYVAPEVLSQHGYGLSVDVWSLGVLLYIMLIGFAPFRCADRAQLFKLIVKAHVTFDMPGWSRVSSKAKQLILKMVTAIVDSRYKSVEVMNNEWIRLHNNNDNENRIN